jgi:hypothetical protein
MKILSSVCETRIYSASLIFPQVSFPIAYLSQKLNSSAELQNQIYEYAAEITARFWPVIRNRDREKSEEQRKRRRMSKSKSKSSSSNSSSYNSDVENIPPLRPQPTFPFIGLTQVCSKIRVDFRGWWMEGHRIPLCELERYLSVFHPRSSLKNRHRFKACVNTAGRLKVWLRKTEFHNRDILQLLKLKLKLPDYTILFEHGPDVKPEEARGLSDLVNNKTPEWLRWLRGRIVTQVRTTRGSVRNSAGEQVHVLAVVVRAEHAPNWMRPTVGGPPPEARDLAKGLGLDGMEHWEARFSVKYD